MIKPVGVFIKITQEKVHYLSFLKSLELVSHRIIVFDQVGAQSTEQGAKSGCERYVKYTPYRVPIVGTGLNRRLA